MGFCDPQFSENSQHTENLSLFSHVYKNVLMIGTWILRVINILQFPLWISRRLLILLLMKFYSKSSSYTVFMIKNLNYYAGRHAVRRALLVFL